MARPAFCPRGVLSVLRFFTIDLSEYAREFGVEIYSKKRLKNSAWDLGGSPPFSPRGRLGSVEAEPSIPYNVISTSIPHRGGGEFSRRIRTTKERFFNIFRETMYTMLGSLRVETT